MKRRAFLATISAAALAGVSGRAHAATPIRIGAINPYSGGPALYGDETTPGYELAASLVNTKGGVLGRSVENFTAYVGAQMMFEAVQAAGSTEFEKVREAAAKLDKPLGSYANGFGIKFDDHMQNTRAKPIVGQWQAGEVATVFPEQAVPPGGKFVSMARS